MKLFIGLGNKGENYKFTRHNIGFMIIDNYLKQHYNFSVKKKNNYHLIEAYINFTKIYFMKPMTFMNKSGIAIRDYIRYNQLSEQDILVITDDINLEFGKIRLRKNGSAGGHNGLKSIINCLGTDDFPRLRIGIGMPAQTENYELSNYVLEKFSKHELNKLQDLFILINEIINMFIDKNEIDKIMNLYNNKSIS